jgi:hypothetical protein
MWEISRIVPRKAEKLSRFDLAVEEFNQAYADLRKECPEGDLTIRLSVGDNHELRQQLLEQWLDADVIEDDPTKEKVTLRVYRSLLNDTMRVLR